MNYGEVVIQTLGGLGLFLLGMSIMTEGLRALAGAAMRRYLMRFTRSPLSGAVTGTATTAILQSSSATTVAAVGFVSAGLMSFSQALGIIFGANLGTTLTGWIVALIGFKLKLGTALLPVVFVGSALRLMFRGRVAALGTALAGFGLIFIGIDQLQSGMAGLPAIISPEDLPQGGVLSALGLVGLGMLATVITQSSSAGVATAMAALAGGAIDFTQAASLIIGMDIGTTVTAALATIGGGNEARRTGLSHVIYNLLTGVGALLLLPVFLQGWAMTVGLPPAEVALVAFHTGFNLLGVMAVLPFSRQFAALVRWLVPDQRGLSVGLDTRLLADPPAAMRLTHEALLEQARHLISWVEQMLIGQRLDAASVAEVQRELDRIQHYADNIELDAQNAAQQARLIALIHALDHLQRLHERCEEEPERAAKAGKASLLAPARLGLLQALQSISRALDSGEWQEAVAVSQAQSLAMQNAMHQVRDDVIRAASQGQIDIADSTLMLQSYRWMRRVSLHIAHVCDYLGQEVVAAAGHETPNPTAPDGLNADPLS